MCGCITLGPSVYARSVAIGPSAPALPDCRLVVVASIPNEDRDVLRRVGSVCIGGIAGDEGLRSTDGIEADADALVELRRHACALGGDVASAAGICNLTQVVHTRGGALVVSLSGIEYHIFRRQPVE